MADLVPVLAGVAAIGVLLVALILVLTRRRGTAPVPPALPDGPLGPRDWTAFRARYCRRAFRPETAPGDERRSRFGGRAWLPEGAAWPACGHCGEPLQLLLQLDLDELPDGAPPRRSGGLAQLFYCTNTAAGCEVEAQAWAPRSRAALARVVDPEEPGSVPEKEPVREPFPALDIVGWEELDDLPSSVERDALGVELTPEAQARAEDEELTIPGDKLGGWAAWLQGIEYPACPDCGEPMELLFQIDSRDHRPWTFGDPGTGHLTRCPRHSTRLAFGWACS